MFQYEPAQSGQQAQSFSRQERPHQDGDLEVLDSFQADGLLAMGFSMLRVLAVAEVSLIGLNRSSIAFIQQLAVQKP